MTPEESIANWPDSYVESELKTLLAMLCNADLVVVVTEGQKVAIDPNTVRQIIAYAKRS